MNQQPDLSKRPEGATHWHPRANGYEAHWVKIDGGERYFCATGFEAAGWVRDVKGPATSKLVELPPAVTPVRPLPVGSEARLARAFKLTEGTVLTEFPAGTPVRIGGYANFGGADVAVINVVGRHYTGTVLPELLEAVPTAEQIAAEKRAVAVSAMLADAGVTGSAWNDDPETVVWAEALYDAGYRKS